MPTGTTSTSPIAPVYSVSTTMDSMPARAEKGLPLRDRVPSRKTSKNCCCLNNSSVYCRRIETKGTWERSEPKVNETKYPYKVLLKAYVYLFKVAN